MKCIIHMSVTGELLYYCKKLCKPVKKSS